MWSVTVHFKFSILLHVLLGVCLQCSFISTGAVYCDRMLRMGGFDGEGVQSGAVLVVKIHSPTPLWTKVKGQPEFSAKVSTAVC